MKKRTKIIFTIAIIIAAAALFSVPALAVTEDEVKAKVAETSKEAVSGNVFIWFLCAIAFLKVSQKIDSFMSSLGINVGHTGGNMLAEALVATRGISEGKRMFGGGFRSGKSLGGNSGNTGAGGGRFMSGGLAGAVSRQFNKSAISSATNQGGNAVTRNAFQSSMAKGGNYANNIISSVAKGDINQMGSITGDTASKAMLSYMGHAGNEAAQSNPISDIEGGHTVGARMPGGQSDDSQAGTNIGIPSYSNVEIGGGRIMGTETTAEHPEGVQFGMYHTEQYTAPEGNRRRAAE